jgi:hypothetical protein
MIIEPHNSSTDIAICVIPDVGAALPCPTVISVKKLKYRLWSQSNIV